MRHFVSLLAFGALLSGCMAPVPPPAPRAESAAAGSAQTASPQRQAFDPAVVSRRVEPVAEAICRSQLPTSNCDFLILVDTRQNQPANAFQTVDENGRPVIVITQPLLDDMRNSDEMAFVLGHEAAHHIQEHLTKIRTSALLAAVSEGFLNAMVGGTAAEIENAQQQGFHNRSRKYSRQYELEADRLGTRIAARAGYDPVAGSLFFARLPDPGDKFLGSHPPNAERQRAVRETAAQIR